MQSFDAKGDGVTDDRVPILRTLLAAKHLGGGEVVFPPGTYRLESPLEVTDVHNLRLTFQQDAVLDFSGLPKGSTCFTMRGGITENVTTLTAAVARGATTLTLAATTGIIAGDVFRLTSSGEVFDPERTKYFKGEYIRIKSVDSGTRVSLTQPTYDSYSVSSFTVRLDRLNLARNITITGMTLVGKGTGGKQYGLRTIYLEGVSLQGCVFRRTERTGFEANNCLDVRVTDCHAEDCNETGLGYGFRAYGSDGFIVSHCTGRNNRHTTDCDARFPTPPSRNIIYSENIVRDNSSAGLSTHANAEFVQFISNHVIGCGGGIINRAKHALIEGNFISGVMGGAESYLHGIRLGDGAPHAIGEGVGGTHLQLRNNVIRINRVGTSHLHGIYATTPLINADISSNWISGFSSHGVYLTGYTMRDTRIADNSIDCSNQDSVTFGTWIHGFWITPRVSSSGRNQKHVTFSRNRIISPFGSGLRVNGNIDDSSPSQDLAFLKNEVINHGARGVDLTEGYFDRVTVDGLRCPQATLLTGNARAALGLVQANHMTPPRVSDVQINHDCS